MNKDNTIIGYANDAQIEQWKIKYNLKHIPEIITIDDDGTKHATYAKKPNLELLQMLAQYAKKDQEIKGLEILFNTLRIGGSETVIDDDEMKLAAMGKIGQLFKQKEATLKKR